MEVNMAVEALKTQLIQERRVTSNLSRANTALAKQVKGLQKDSQDLQVIRRALGIKT